MAISPSSQLIVPDAGIIKAEPLDFKLELPVYDTKGLPGDAQGRMVVEVVVPTLSQLIEERKKSFGPDVKLDVDFGKPLKVKRGKQELTLDADTINKRLDAFGTLEERTFPVTLDPESRDTTFPRRFFSHQYGGNTQSTYPEIRQDFIDQHGITDWMYPNSLWNPNCPLMAGHTGLFFHASGIYGPRNETSKPWRTIVRMKEGPQWLYIGEYVLVGCPSLTREEWLIQSPQVKNIWVNEIVGRGRRVDVRARIALRKTLKWEPTKQELKQALEKLKPGEHGFTSVTVDDVSTAYNEEKECIGVDYMKCVGYIEEFQRDAIARFKTWVPQKKKTSKKRTPAEGGTKLGKRKRVVEVESESELEEDTKHAYCDDEDKEDNIVEEVKYTPRGTRSRPSVR